VTRPLSRPAVMMLRIEIAVQATNDISLTAEAAYWRRGIRKIAIVHAIQRSSGECRLKQCSAPAARAVSRVHGVTEHAGCTSHSAGVYFSMQPEQSIVIDPKNPGGASSLHGLILFDGVCILCSRCCRFVSQRDRRGYFRFVPIQLAEGRSLAEQLGIDPDHPDSFAFVAKGHGYVKSEAVLRIAREIPGWRCTWVFHLIPRVIRDAIYAVVARHRYRWFGRRDACILPSADRSWSA
jgi:predicted DCC family thiol-disulfide oxidoreductase YuxK